MAGKYNRKDHYYAKAKAEGFRSRASYKLMELDKKYHLLKNGMSALDLGAWPGGWMQVMARRAGSKGVVVGIDLVEIDGFPEQYVHTFTGDVRDEVLLEKAKSLAGGGFDIVVSDMSPKLTGIKEVDRLAASGVAELALWAAGETLKPGGSFVVKVFKGNETETFVKSSRPLFNKLIRAELSSTRKTSNEFYVVGLGYKPQESIV